jgi:hypothetical protein
MDPAAGVAVRVTAVPPRKLAAQAVPQLTPAGLLVTVPVPLPYLLIERLYWTGENEAVTFCAWDMTSVQVVAVPVQAPDHPRKEDPATAAAVSVTLLLAVRLALHVVPQLIPAGLLVTVPVPDLLMVRV